ncbi:MAG: hypothetical protein CMJ76_02015 [Planctomycetaceae bacterium]|nr:hypothetical protein [Planctomycetaceae bacterium]
MRITLLTICLSFSFCSNLSGQQTLKPADFTKPIELSRNVLDSSLKLTITPRLAGAVHSIQWKEHEFIDSHDHGRQMQSASNFDLATDFHGETFNPTEAGSRNDGAGPTSTSKLLHISHTKEQLQTTTQMAFWLAPDQKSSGNPAKNRTLLSNHLLTKRITLGFQQWPNVIRYEATFTTPIGEFHRYAQFEAVTGYMPERFNTFWGVHLSRQELVPLTDGPGEQRHPVIIATKDRTLAMGVYAPQQPSKGYENAGYGRFRFPAAKVTKWNSVFRIQEKTGVPAGDYYYDNYVVIGDLTTVTNTILKLDNFFHGKDQNN